MKCAQPDGAACHPSRITPLASSTFNYVCKNRQVNQETAMGDAQITFG